jgi:hypothetical protein
MRYMFAISATDPAGQLPQGSGSSVRASPQVTFIRMVSDSNFVSRATPFVRWVEHFESYCHEMLFERSSLLCYPCADLSAEEAKRTISKRSGAGEVYGTTDWTASTLPRKLGNGRIAGG